jgi:hypothetical protein
MSESEADLLRVVSVSIGSSRRDHEVELELLGRRIRISREGTDGDLDAAVRRIGELDGRVDAIGLGGVDLYIHAAGRRYVLKDPQRMAEAATRTPTLDGTGLKNSLEREAVRFMADECGASLRGKRALVTSAVDRFGLAEGLHESGCRMRFGDLLFGLGIPVTIRSWWLFNIIAMLAIPVVRRLPFRWLYPVGAQQEVAPDARHARFYREADIIAGDYLYVRQYMPEDMTGKWVITNTTTAQDVEELRRRGVELLVTTTPRLSGRSFGTNVMEAALVALAGAEGPLDSERYLTMLAEAGLSPEATWLQDERPCGLPERPVVGDAEPRAV